MRNRTLFAVLGAMFVVVFSVYALLACLHLFGKGNIEGIVNGGIVIVIWLAICVFPVLYLTGKFNNFFGKFTPVKKIDDDAMQRPNNLKNILPMFFILLAVALGLLIYWIVITVRTASDDFVRCEAVLTEYGCAFTDKAGVLHYIQNSASWGGVYFENGSRIIIYYELFNPENVIHPANNVMLFAVSWFFLTADLIMLSSAFNRYASIIPVFAGLLFTVVAVCTQIGIALAGGLDFYNTILSGATAYIMNVLFVLGLYTLVFGLVKTFKPQK